MHPYRQVEGLSCLLETRIKLVIVPYLNSVGRHAKYLICQWSNVGCQRDHESQQLAQIMPPGIFYIVVSQDGSEALLDSLLGMETGCIQSPFCGQDGVCRDQIVCGLFQ